MKDDKLHRMTCSHCDSVELFDSVPIEWRCDSCDYMNGYSNKTLMHREVEFSGGKYVNTNDAGEKLQSTEDTLKERGNRYGEFRTHAEISQKLKELLVLPSFEGTDCDLYMYEAMEMICHKLARIANGDPTYIDSWADICGYSQLVVDELTKEQK